MPVIEKIIEGLKLAVENAEEAVRVQATIKGQLNAMAHVQGMIVKSLAVVDPRIQSFFLENLKDPKNVLQGTALDTGIFEEYIAWMRQLASGEGGDPASPSRPAWLKVFDGGKSDTSPTASAEEEPPT
jgi:hypothetical protein